MRALAILEEGRRHGLRFSIKGDKLHVEPVPSPETLERLRCAKPEIVAALKLEALAAEACKPPSGYITPARLIAKLAPEDLADVQGMADPLPFLRSFATATVWTEMRQRGIAPPGWDKCATCERCGPVFLWAEIKVAGCPWCWNRTRGVRIPRPPTGAQINALIFR